MLDDALSLFRPRLAPPTDYKPSLLSSARNGPLLEQLKHRKPHTVPESSLHLNRLAASLDILFTPEETLSANTKLLKCSDKEFKRAVASIASERQLADLARLLVAQDAMTLNRLRMLVLSPHLKNLNALPFDVNAITTETLKLWDELDVVRFQIVMLRKYHDLKKPINVIKNLKLNFESRYLPKFEPKMLNNFYERIVWRYYFEYMGDSLAPKEPKYIDMFHDVYHTFAIWQASHRNQLVAHHALRKHSDLNELQKLFFEVCSSGSVNNAIASEQQHGRSDILSTLKRVSIVYNLHSIPPLEQAVSPETRTSYYMVIDSLEKIIQRVDAPDLQTVKHNLDGIRNVLTKRDNSSPELDWEDKLLFLQNYMK